MPAAVEEFRLRSVAAEPRVVPQRRSASAAPAPHGVRDRVERTIPSGAQADAPYLDALERYVAPPDGGAPTKTFHTPGHIQGESMDPQLRRVLGAAASHDLCVLPALGDPYDDPTAKPYAENSPIGKAMLLAAEAVGADRTFFGVNGSTGSNHVLLTAALRPGDELILPRHVHKSVVHALVDVGANPIFLEPEFDEDRKVALPPTLGEIERAMDVRPGAKVVLVVSPTYYGDVADVAAIARAVHARGKTLIVDGAWGAHFPYHSSTRALDGLAAGADGIVHSVHKSTGSLTQTSMLHVRGPRIDPKRVEAAYMLRGTTSPSVLMLASIDGSRRQMRIDGERCLGATIATVARARRELAKIDGIRVVGGTVRGPRSGETFKTDPAKLMFTVDDLGITGYEAHDFLRREHGIEVEISNHSSVVALCTHGTTAANIEDLLAGVRDLAVRLRRPKSARGAATMPGFAALPPQRMLPRQAFFAPKASISLERAAGSVSAATITSFPPATPLAIPGEELTPRLVAHLRDLLERNVHVHGVVGATPGDRSVEVVRPDALPHARL